MGYESSARPRRYLAVWLPFLPADRLSRQERRSPERPERDEPPLVFVEKVKSALRLAAVDPRACGLGLASGLTLADARARVPHLRAVGMDRAADARFLERLADLCECYTPLVALDAPDGLILDITGCAHLFGGEAGLRTDLLERLARLGIKAQACIAGTPEGACALARFGNATVIGSDQQAEAVAPLPVAALGIDAETVTALLRTGLKTVGELAVRPRPALAARFGSGVVARLVRISGKEDVRISPRRPLPAVIAERRFAEPITQADDALSVLASLAGQMARLLEERGKGGRRFEAGFYRTDGKVMRLHVETGRPLRDPQALVRLFRERLEALSDPLDPGFGFDLIRLAVMAGESFAVVQRSLDRSETEEDELGALIDRLGARFGIRAVLRFMPRGTHIPELAEQIMPAAAMAGQASLWPLPEAGAPPARPLHLFEPPQPIEALAEVPDGPPLRFRWRRLLHEVTRAEGPERIAPEWWRAGKVAATRDYYRVEDAAGRRFWVFREGFYAEEMAPRWFLHGVFA